MTNKTNSQDDSGMDTIVDPMPVFCNYLKGLKSDDLVAELVQNDLDQNATRTVISFKEDRLVCEGNGEPVNDDGWKRLSLIWGAGSLAPAKRGKIGVKNHGLKTAFRIGDEIHLMSAGKKIKQTLYRNGRDKDPLPGASKKPTPDPQAPSKGCRIVIPYRRTFTELNYGEPLELHAIDDSEIEELFRRACKNTLEQFVGIVSPDLVSKYKIVLKHWELGEVSFQFSYKGARKINKRGKRMEIFQRQCTVSGSASSLSKGVGEQKEQAVRRLLPLKSLLRESTEEQKNQAVRPRLKKLRERIADFYRRESHFYVEVSWPINRSGIPKIGKEGRFRYPIGYPQNSQEALTGHGVHFNAPFASDNKRQHPVRDDIYEKLRQACESLLVDAIAIDSVPSYGPHGLNPLVPNKGSNNHKEAVRTVLEPLAKRGNLPLLNWRKATELILKGKKRTSNEELRRLAKSPKKDKRYRFVIPVASWDSDKIEPTLSLLCPRSEMQLDPWTDREIIKLLSNSNEETKLSGFYEDFITFDEVDAFDRVTGRDNNYFGGIADLERELAHLLIVRSYLDLIDLAIKQGECNEDKQQELIKSLLIPDINGTARAFRDLYLSVDLPRDVPELKPPHSLHADLAKHQLFERPNWSRQKYTMAKFLKSSVLQGANESTRKRFWRWLRRNERLITTRDRSKLADLAIWPDSTGHLHKLSEFCVPRSQRIAKILADEICRPHKHVRQSNLISTRHNSPALLRRTATKGEIGSWLKKRNEEFQVGEHPDVDTEKRLRSFEDNLAILLKNKEIALILKSVAESTKEIVSALAQDGSIQHRTKLVMPSPENKLLELPGQFMLKDKRHATALRKIWPTLNSPTAEMLLDAFDNNSKALQARLRCFLNLTSQGDPDRLELADTPIIPVGDKGTRRAPSKLAFRGKKDYWGSWKTRITGKGLSNYDRGRYLEVGVTSSNPKPETSRAFFEWLSSLENQAELKQHMRQVLRHILHHDGPVNWANYYDDIPFIPVNGKNGLELVSLKMARNKPIFLSDTGEKEEDIRSKNRLIKLVVDHEEGVEEPISEQLLELGAVRSLREELGEPQEVIGESEIARVEKEDTISLINKLRDKEFQRTFLKRLQELDVSPELVDQKWKDRLNQINQIRFAGKVTANYLLFDKQYSKNVDAGLDNNSEIFWIRDDKETSEIYEAIAQQLVFTPNTPRGFFLTLERTVNMEFKDRISGDTPMGEGDSEETEEDIISDTLRGHSKSKFDGELDKGKELKPGPIRDHRSSGTKGTSSTRRRKQQEKTPQIEMQDIKKLKSENYFNHCQICLCNQSPQELAPAGSYIEQPRFRQSVIEANHVDPKAAGGARHAGNLILLCKSHHEEFGDQLNRVNVTEALSNTEERKVIYFPNGVLEGWQVKDTISATGEAVKFFFTDSHRDFWLEQAANESA